MNIAMTKITTSRTWVAFWYDKEGREKWQFAKSKEEAEQKVSTNHFDGIWVAGVAEVNAVGSFRDVPIPVRQFQWNETRD